MPASRSHLCHLTLHCLFLLPDPLHGSPFIWGAVGGRGGVFGCNVIRKVNYYASGLYSSLYKAAPTVGSLSLSLSHTHNLQTQTTGQGVLKDSQRKEKKFYKERTKGGNIYRGSSTAEINSKNIHLLFTRSSLPGAQHEAASHGLVSICQKHQFSATPEWQEWTPSKCNSVT